MKDKERITEWVKEDEKVKTNNGVVLGKEWIEREAKRICGKGDSVEVEEKRFGGVKHYCLKRTVKTNKKGE
jgi:hypothetical protein